MDNPAETTPYLLEAVSNPDEVWRKLEENDDYILPIYSLLMPAQFREKQAYPPVCQIFAESDDDRHDLFGDFIAEDLDSVLASVSGGDMTLINRLIKNEKTDRFVRSAGIDAWLCLLAAGD